jgi:hypothetical protein
MLIFQEFSAFITEKFEIFAVWKDRTLLALAGASRCIM